MSKAYDRVSWYLLIWCGESWQTIGTQSLSMVRGEVSFNISKQASQPSGLSWFLHGSELTNPGKLGLVVFLEKAWQIDDGIHNTTWRRNKQQS